MTKSLLLTLVVLVVGLSAGALAWWTYGPPPARQTTAPQVADAPSSRGIFPKVLNR